MFCILCTIRHAYSKRLNLKKKTAERLIQEFILISILPMLRRFSEGHGALSKCPSVFLSVSMLSVTVNTLMLLTFSVVRL